MVIAIISILAALLMPALKSAKDKAKSVACMNNLRQNGFAIITYTGDNQGKWLYNDNSSPPPRLWHNILRSYNYISSYGNTVCPSWPPYVYNPLQPYGAYGVNYFGKGAFPDDTGIQETTAGVFYILNIFKITNPANFLLLADSVTTRPGPHQYHIVQDNGFLDEIHLRHASHANALFADGHVQACDTVWLKQCGWHWACDQDGNFISY